MLLQEKEYGKVSFQISRSDITDTHTMTIDKIQISNAIDREHCSIYEMSKIIQF